MLHQVSVWNGAGSVLERLSYKKEVHKISDTENLRIDSVGKHIRFVPNANN